MTVTTNVPNTDKTAASKPVETTKVEATKSETPNLVNEVENYLTSQMAGKEKGEISLDSIKGAVKVDTHALLEIVRNTKLNAAFVVGRKGRASRMVFPKGNTTTAPKVTKARKIRRNGIKRGRKLFKIAAPVTPSFGNSLRVTIAGQVINIPVVTELVPA